jgi:hypothetical protein
VQSPKILKDALLTSNGESEMIFTLLFIAQTAKNREPIEWTKDDAQTIAKVSKK